MNIPESAPKSSPRSFPPSTTPPRTATNRQRASATADGAAHDTSSHAFPFHSTSSLPMALAEPAPASTAPTKSSAMIESHLRGLLGAIQKPTLDPPLTVADLDAERFELLKPAGGADEFYKTSLENAHKAVLYDIAVRLAFRHVLHHPVAHLLIPPPSPHRSGKIKMTPMTTASLPLEICWTVP